MQLTPQQEALVRAWAAEGATLSDIQTRLADECGLRLSYLDTRFLLLDLKVDLVEKTRKDPPPRDLAAAAPEGGADAYGSAGDAEEPPVEDDAYGAAPPLPGEEDPGAAGGADADGAAGGAGEPPAPLEDDAAPGASTLTVELARIQRPGFAASGSVTCSDGVKGEWGIDAYGRLALAFPDNRGYRPSAADQQAFMQQLRGLLAGGY